MKNIFLKFLLAGTAITLLSACSQLKNVAYKQEDFAEKINRINNLELTTPEKSKQWGDVYAARFGSALTPEQLATKTTDELQELFAATALVAFYDNEQAYARKLLAIADERIRRDGIESFKPQAPKLFKMLLRHRLFDDARRYQTLYPAVSTEAVPTLQVATTFNPQVPSVLRATATASGVLTRTNIDYKQGAKVMIVAHPYCGFSAKAMMQLKADSAIAQRLLPASLWIAPQDGNFSYQALREWSQQQAPLNIAMAYFESELPEIDEWDTPHFYFFKDGRLVAKFSGWPREGNMALLTDGLAKIGL